MNHSETDRLIKIITNTQNGIDSTQLETGDLTWLCEELGKLVAEKTQWEKFQKQLKDAVRDIKFKSAWNIR